MLAVETGATLRRAALVCDGVLEAIEIDCLSDAGVLPGAIWRCRITGTIPGINAATADLGNGIEGFFPDGAGLSAGQSLLAEVRREADGEKAARLSPALQLRSAHLVFTPARPGINVSRKINDEAERARLRAALDPFSERGGFVIRTDARGLPRDALHDEAASLTARYDSLAANPAPGLRAAPPDAVARILGNAGPVDAVIADEASLDGLPESPVPRRDPAPFEALDIDAAVGTLLSARHDLTDGWISIDPTPALVAIDVNTGGNAPLRVNLDAARSIPRLLSLKKLGGLVIVDFAGGPTGEDRMRIAGTFQRAASRWLEGTRIAGWGPAGLFELVSPRPGRSLATLMTEDTP